MLPSLFKIIGPAMIGPSSSHTAGMNRIGLIAGQIAARRPQKIVITLHEALRHTYKGHRTDAALVGGALGIGERDEALKEALSLASREGIGVSVGFFEETNIHPNTVRLSFFLPGGALCEVEGISIGGGAIEILKIDGASLSLSPDLFSLILWSREEISPPLLSLFSGAKIVFAKAGGLFVSIAEFLKRPDEREFAELNKIRSVLRWSFVEKISQYAPEMGKAPLFSSCREILNASGEQKTSLSSLAVEYEKSRGGEGEQEIRARMAQHLATMRASCRRGLLGEAASLCFLTSGQDAKALWRAIEEKKTVSGGIVPKAIARAIAVMEVNASMGVVVACPTAGSAGIMPGCLLACGEEYGLSDEALVDALLAAALLGCVMRIRGVSFSGAVGGCQGEIGVSSALAAAALCSLFTDDAQKIVHAMALSLKSTLGLICDPVAGPVEVPCIKRNALGAANAFASADLALAGIQSFIPPDEVLDALIHTQNLLPRELKGGGGLSCTGTALRLREKLSEGIF